MKILLLLTCGLISFNTFSNKSLDVHEAHQWKIKDIIKKNIFNGKWTDSWGSKVAVINIVTFPANCKIKVNYSKSSKSFIYKSDLLIDLHKNPPVDIAESKTSSAVKLIFQDKIVNTTARNLRNSQVRNIKEKVATFYHRPMFTNGYPQNLIDVLLSYQEICK